MIFYLIYVAVFYSIIFESRTLPTLLLLLLLQFPSWLPTAYYISTAALTNVNIEINVEGRWSPRIESIIFAISIPIWGLALHCLRGGCCRLLSWFNGHPSSPLLLSLPSRFPSPLLPSRPLHSHCFGKKRDLVGILPRFLWVKQAEKKKKREGEVEKSLQARERRTHICGPDEPPICLFGGNR